MPTEKRHIYSTGTKNVTTGNVVVEQDINYFNANDESAMKSIIRYVEDEGQKFRQNQVYDGLSLSNAGGSLVNISAGNGFVGGRWGTVESTNIDFAGSGSGNYDVFIRMTANVDTPRNPSTGETYTVVFEPTSGFSYSDNDLYLGNVNLTGVGVLGVISSIGSRRIDTRYIRPYGTATSVSVLTGSAPAYQSAFDFLSATNQANLPLVAVKGISSTQGFSGTTIETTGVVDVGTDLGVAANTYLSGTLEVDGVTDVYNHLNVTMNTYLSGTLKTDGQVDFYDKLYVTDNFQVSGSSRVEGRSDVEGVFEVGGAVHLSGTQTVDSDSILIGNVGVGANTYLSGTLQVDGIVNMYGSNLYAQELYISGTVGADGIIESQSYMSGTQFHSNVTGGTPPFVVQSTQKVANLNVDLLDGLNTGATSGSIPINDGALNLGLNSDLLDGQEGSYYSVKATTDAHAALSVQHLTWTTDQGGNNIHINNLPIATTSIYGATKLATSVSSTSTSLAATSSAVRLAYNKGNGDTGHSHSVYASTSHTHTLANSNINEQIFPASMLVTSVNGGATIVQNDSIDTEISFDSSGNGEVHFAIPYFQGRTVDKIVFGGKGSGNTIHGQPIRRYNNGTSAGIATEQSATWGASHAEISYINNWSHTDTGHALQYRLRRTIGSVATLHISSVAIFYSN